MDSVCLEEKVKLAGIWYLTEWLRLGKPAKTQIIELGPGKGTLMSDMLRVRATACLDTSF